MSAAVLARYYLLFLSFCCSDSEKTSKARVSGGGRALSWNWRPSVRDHGKALVVPGEGFEPPTFGLQNRCTTTVLTRRYQYLNFFPQSAHRTSLRHAKTRPRQSGL
jgi:hypothetical protein